MHKQVARLWAGLLSSNPNQPPLPSPPAQETHLVLIALNLSEACYCSSWQAELCVPCRFSTGRRLRRSPACQHLTVCRRHSLLLPLSCHQRPITRYMSLTVTIHKRPDHMAASSCCSTQDIVCCTALLKVGSRLRTALPCLV